MKSALCIFLLAVLLSGTEALKLKWFGLPYQKGGYLSYYSLDSNAVPVWCFDRPIDMKNEEWHLTLDGRFMFEKHATRPIQFQTYQELKAQGAVHVFDYKFPDQPGVVAIDESKMKFGVFGRKKVDLNAPSSDGKAQCWGAVVNLANDFGVKKQKSSYRWILSKKRKLWFDWKAKSGRFTIYAPGSAPKPGFVRNTWYKLTGRGPNGAEDPLHKAGTDAWETCRTFSSHLQEECVKAINSYSKNPTLQAAVSKTDSVVEKPKGWVSRQYERCLRFFGKKDGYCEEKFPGAAQGIEMTTANKQSTDAFVGAGVATTSAGAAAAAAAAGAAYGYKGPFADREGVDNWVAFSDQDQVASAVAGNEKPLINVIDNFIAPPSDEAAADNGIDTIEEGDPSTYPYNPIMKTNFPPLLTQHPHRDPEEEEEEDGLKDLRALAEQDEQLKAALRASATGANAISTEGEQGDLDGDAQDDDPFEENGDQNLQDLLSRFDDLKKQQ